MRNSGRFVAPVKRATQTEPITVIIPAAGAGSRIKSYGPKALLDIHNESLLDRQIRILNKKYNNPEIIVVVGFEAERVIASNKSVRFVENENYDTTNVVRSINMALRATLSKRILIVYGDLVFNEETLDFPTNHSCIISSATQMNDKEVGFISNKNLVCNFSYDLENKWCHIAYLDGAELELFRKLCAKKDNAKLFSHEVFNYMIDMNSEFIPHSPTDMKILEIDSLKDMERLFEFR